MATPETAAKLLQQIAAEPQATTRIKSMAEQAHAYLRAHDAASVQPAPDAQVEGEDWKAKYEAADGAVQRLKNILDGHAWLAEGRGPYRYDDGHYDDEVMAVFRELLEACDEGHWEPWQTVLSRLREYEWKERNAASQAPATDALRKAVREALNNCSIDNHGGADDYACPFCNKARAALGQQGGEASSTSS